MSKVTFISERKRRINFFHINFLCRPSSPGLSQGQTGFVPGTNPGLPGFQCKIRRKPGFVPGFHRVCPRNKPGVKSPDKPGAVPRPTGQKSLCSCAFFLPDLCDNTVAGLAPWRDIALSLVCQGQTRVCRASTVQNKEEKPGLSQDFTGFVPGTSPVWNPRDKPGAVPRPTGQKSLCLCAFFLLDLCDNTVAGLAPRRYIALSLVCGHMILPFALAPLLNLPKR